MLFFPSRCSAKGDLRRGGSSHSLCYAINKSPYSDGYSVEFYRLSWSIVGADLVAALQEFSRNGRLLKNLNCTALALIPKTPESCKLSDFRPISLCNMAYKVISKIIANMQKPLLQQCISPNQAAFLKGRSLEENVLLACELIRHYRKPSNAKSCMIKVDLRKAFDTVCWDFVLKLLEAHLFPPLFRTWIKECIASTRFSVLINKELADFFEGKKGLRQGDPLSPYLFIMVMEAMSKMLEAAARNSKFDLHPRCDQPLLTHLLFADDLLLFSNGSRDSIKGLLEVLADFKSLSGLDMNASKSKIFFSGYSATEVNVLTTISIIKPESFPTRYLGLLLSPKKLNFAALQPFLERITSKIHSWTAKFLSFAGKIRLISSVVYEMVNFWSQIFVLPKKFYERVDSLCSSFLWRNKSSPSPGAREAWEDVCMNT